MTTGEVAGYGNLGTVLNYLGEYVKAKEYLVICDTKGEAAWYGNLGTVFQYFGDYLKAEEYHGKALVISKVVGIIEGIAADYGNLETV